MTRDPRSDADAADAHFKRGVSLENEDDPTGARSAYQRTVELDPAHAEAVASLAWLDAQAGNTASARAWGERALALDRANVLARMALAFAELQERHLDAAGRRLVELYADPALTPINRSIVLGLIGDLNDAQGVTARAFKAYEASNAQLQPLGGAFEAPGKESALDHARRLIRWFEAPDLDAWRRQPEASADADAPNVHAFLVGFPRSGTTLLETVLAGHPEVVTLEERETLAEAAAAYLTSNEGLARLAEIDSEEAARQRERYWASVRGLGVEPRGCVFIDKMPLATVLLPLISKIFPNARILFAVRDPRDVVFSCFRRRFGMNASMFQFMTLEGAATYYDAVMHLAEIYRELLPTPQHSVRYESLVEDFEGTARGICDFIGLEWTPAIADIAATARSRGIATPSAAQLARGLNREGHGAWRRYEEQMAPVLPMLEPWVKRFAYDPN